MKLFRQLMVAPASLILLAPIAGNASEVNLNEVSNYSDEGIEITSKSFENNLVNTEALLLAGGEGLTGSPDNDGPNSFSETTTASFSADMAIGAEDGGSEAVQAYYGFQIDLNTSFTGEDSLDISIDAGNAGGAVTEFDLNGAHVTGGSDVLNVDGVSYTFPVGDKTTVLVGDNIDGSELFSTACVYGGPSNTLDDCGNVNAAIVGGGTAIGASYDIGNGFTAAVGYAGPGSETAGLMTKEGADAYGLNVMYTADTYGVSVTYGMTEDANGLDDSYTALNGYWNPDGFPSVSVGYEVGDDGSAAATADELTSYFVGLQWDEVGPGTFGIAAGTSTPKIEGGSELLMYEAFYSYSVNDGMTVTPLVYMKETAAGSDDKTGVMVKTSFSF
jgi:hypothetical protein